MPRCCGLSRAFNNATTVRLSPLTEFDYMNFPKVFSKIEFSKSTKVENITVFQ